MTGGIVTGFVGTLKWKATQEFLVMKGYLGALEAIREEEEWC